MGSSARPYGPRRSIVFLPQNYNIQSIGSALRFGPRDLPLLLPLHENTTQMWARPCGPRLWSFVNAPDATFSPPRRAPRGLVHAALDPTMLSVYFLIHFMPIYRSKNKMSDPIHSQLQSSLVLFKLKFKQIIHHIHDSSSSDRLSSGLSLSSGL